MRLEAPLFFTAIHKRSFHKKDTVGFSRIPVSLEVIYGIFQHKVGKYVVEKQVNLFYTPVIV